MVDAAWRKSSFSNGIGECVELADLGDSIGVRDSKNPGDLTLFLTRGELRAFIEGVKAGEFDDLTG